MAESYPVGQAPWEQSAPQSFPVGQAPWESSQPQSQGSGNEFLDAHPNLLKAVQGGLSDLPTAGAMVGGAVGAAGGAGVASVATGAVGAGVGAAAGVQARDKLNEWIFGKKTDPNKTADNMAKEGAENFGAQAVGGLLLKGLGAGAKWTAEKVVPKAVIERYQQAADAVKSLISSSDGDIAEAADQVKTGITSSLDEFRSAKNAEIANALKNNTTLVKGNRILDQLKTYADSLDPDLYAAEKAQVSSLIDSVAKKVDQRGDMLVSDANLVKQFLQEKATAAYRLAGESGGGSEVAQAAKQGAAIARKVVNEAVPEVAAANERLATLHYIEDRMNKSLIRAGKSEAGLVAAGKYSPGGSEGNATNAKALKLLGELTGQDFLGKAQDLATMKTLAGGSLLKSGVGAGIGAAAGAGIAEVSGNDPLRGAEVGGLLGGAVTSPAAIKSAIDVGRYVAPTAVSPAAQTLGQAVMHGTGATRSLRKIGGQ